jgi:hypothetical protein
MSFYQSFTSLRTTDPHIPSLVAALRAQDVTAGVKHVAGTPDYTVKKDTPWLAAHINFVQAQIDAAPETSARLVARGNIENWPIEIRALLLALIDQINTLRAGLPSPLPPITPAQALTAVLNKAQTL